MDALTFEQEVALCLVEIGGSVKENIPMPTSFTMDLYRNKNLTPYTCACQWSDYWLAH